MRKPQTESKRLIITWKHTNHPISEESKLKQVPLFTSNCPKFETQEIPTIGDQQRKATLMWRWWDT